MGLTLVEAPATPPVSRDMVKAHLHVEHSDHDSLIDLYIAAETAFCEEFTGRRFVSQIWDYTQDAFPGQLEPQVIRLPLANVTAVDDVFYLDADEAEQTLDAGIYDVDLSGSYARITLAANGSWPTTYDGADGVRVRFTVGSEDTGVSPATPDVLKDMQLAIMLRVQADYEGGEGADALRAASEVYLKRRRVIVSLA